MKHIILTIALIIGLINLSSVNAQSKNKADRDYHQTAETKFIEAGGTKYAYRILGNKQGIPLIFLHGSLWTMDDWDPKVTDGFAQYYKVILFDNKGVGSTNGKTPDNIAAMAKDATVFIKALGYSNVNLLGLSMGGMITQQILLTEPQLVNKVILAGTGPKGSEGLSEVVNTVTAASKLPLNEQPYYLLFGHSAEAKELGKLSLERIQRRTTNRDAAVTNETITAQLTAVLGWSQPSSDALNELKTIKQPVLVVEGRYDILVPVVNSFNLYQSIPNAKLSLYPDAGHASLFQNADLFLNEAVPFLKDK